MNIILLSGGSGKRLWPLSNEVRSKQFIKIFRRPGADDNGPDAYESMVQRVYRQIRCVDPEATVTIATSKSQVSAIYNQIGEVGISVEPCRRDTFPAIALATAYLHDVQGMSADDAVVVCPVDPFVDADYFNCVRDLYEAGRGIHQSGRPLERRRVRLPPVLCAGQGRSASRHGGLCRAFPQLRLAQKDLLRLRGGGAGDRYRGPALRRDLEGHRHLEHLHRGHGGRGDRPRHDRRRLRGRTYREQPQSPHPRHGA